VKLICFGDSLTFGYGVKRECNWVEVLKLKLKVEVLNKGINGDSTAGMLSRSYKDIIKNSPTHTIIMAGTNDFLAGRSVSNVVDNIYMLLEECETNNIIPILAIQPPILSEMAERYWAKGITYEVVNEKIKNYRKILVDYASNKNIYIIDFYTSFQIDYLNKHSDLFIDGIHPTKDGHKIMADLICKIFE
jgi:lysophospholipase L1-like esterase